MKEIWENLFRKKVQTRRLVRFLKDMSFFEEFSEKEISVISEFFHKRQFAEEEIIFKQGEFGMGLYIILSGSVDIFITDATSSDPKKNITSLERADFFGELALLEPESTRMATAVAATGTELLGLFKPDLEELRQRHPFVASKLVLRLSEVLSKRLRALVSRVDEFKKQLVKFQESSDLKDEKLS